MSHFKLLLFDSGLNKERKTVLALLHTFALAVFREAFGQLYEPKCILRTADLETHRLTETHGFTPEFYLLFANTLHVEQLPNKMGMLLPSLWVVYRC